MAPFYNVTSEIKKSIYHKNLVNELTSISSGFDVSKIKGALRLEDYYQHLETTRANSSEKESGDDIQRQLISLKEVPQLSSELQASEYNNFESVEITPIFSKLMSTCYRSIYQVDITSYYSEISRRGSLHLLFEFQQAYVYMKEWIIKSSSWSKGIKSSTQV